MEPQHAAQYIRHMNRNYDAIVIGAGQAGPSLTARFSRAGNSVAIIERHLFGGTCINAGCTPTKTLIASARIAYDARRAHCYGIEFPAASVAVNMRAVQARKKRIVDASKTGLENWIRGLQNCTVYKGHARFESARSVNVDGQVLTSEQIFINVGGRPRIPDFPGIDRVAFMTSTTLLELQELPAHLIIVGGSYVGLEFAQMYRRFGSEVTVIEKASRLLPHEDLEVAAAIQSALEAEGIQIRLEAECIQLAHDTESVTANVHCSEGPPQVTGSHVLVAVGRVPNTDDLGLKKAGVETDHAGFIKVDDELRTNVSGIWALGDCNGKGAFTHTAYNDYEIVAANLFGEPRRRVSDRIPCYALFVDPPLGRVGLTEHDALAQGHAIRIGSRQMTRVARAAEKGETRGLMKVVVDAQSNLILGASILGVGADEAIHSIIDVMAARVPYTTLQNTVHIHPTVSELIPTILGELGEETRLRLTAPSVGEKAGGERSQGGTPAPSHGHTTSG
jgi:pyruvate/2-oxoglutarate dehydrogenase complex dihydrolipoamide dehydrogenase (E3) component